MTSRKINSVFNLEKIPRKATVLLSNKQKLDLLEQQGPKFCEVNIICKNPELKENFDQICKYLDYWFFAEKNEQMFKYIKLPTVEGDTIKKYKRELQLNKDLLVLQSEVPRMCPLLPLLVFPNNSQMQNFMTARNKVARK